METVMWRGIIPAAVVAAVLLAGRADAVPLANLDGAAAPHVTLVYGGCGPYGHRGPFGHCRPGGQWGGYGAGGISACPPGFHLGPYGQHCWPN
jgi:hypothetical protein